MINLSPLLFSTVEQPTLLEQLELSQSQLDTVAEARTAIRACLRDNLPTALQANGHAVATSPRFFTQGSFAYKTLNSPARPVQQADIDDGAYLPLSFLQDTGAPSVAASVFFAAAQKALGPLVAERNWRLLADNAKCIRVDIASYAHVDIPLYAIPDAEFATLQKAAARAEVGGIGRGILTTDAADQDVWDKLPPNSVLLAHREKGWIKSDPRPIKDWFIGEVALHGEQYRRIVRYLKAYRDWQWETGGPSSILLMVAAASVFEQRERRDDLALLAVLERLPAALRDGVCNPVERSESLTEYLGKESLNQAAVAFENLHASLRDALAAQPPQACSLLIGAFGSRFPDAPARVRPSSLAEAIAAIPARIVPIPPVGRTQAG